MASLTSACRPLSLSVGIPSGLFSSVPGLGIQTLLAGKGLVFI
jgi:hypothetical protein